MIWQEWEGWSGGEWKGGREGQGGQLRATAVLPKKHATNLEGLGKREKGRQRGRRQHCKVDKRRPSRIAHLGKERQHRRGVDPRQCIGSVFAQRWCHPHPQKRLGGKDDTHDELGIVPNAASQGLGLCGRGPVSGGGGRGARGRALEAGADGAELLEAGARREHAGCAIVVQQVGAGLKGLPQDAGTAGAGRGGGAKVVAAAKAVGPSAPKAELFSRRASRVQHKAGRVGALAALV